MLSTKEVPDIRKLIEKLVFEGTMDTWKEDFEQALIDIRQYYSALYGGEK